VLEVVVATNDSKIERLTSVALSTQLFSTC
jgi:hypothetical protein